MRAHMAGCLGSRPHTGHGHASIVICVRELKLEDGTRVSRYRDHARTVSSLGWRASGHRLANDATRGIAPTLVSPGDRPGAGAPSRRAVCHERRPRARSSLVPIRSGGCVRRHPLVSVGRDRRRKRAHWRAHTAPRSFPPNGERISLPGEQDGFATPRICARGDNPSARRWSVLRCAPPGALTRWTQVTRPLRGARPTGL